LLIYNRRRRPLASRTRSSRSSKQILTLALGTHVWRQSIVYIHSFVTHPTIASVYLKNRITKRWAPEASDKLRAIPDSEKTTIKQRILPILRSAPPPIRAQLIAALQKILHYDFPDKWPDFLQATTNLLNTQDIGSVFVGLQCLLAICRVYRFKMGDTRADFDKIVEQTFPHLLNIGNSLVNETSLEAGEMLRVVLKAYKHAIYVSRRSRCQQLCANNDIVRTSEASQGTPSHVRLVHPLPDCGCEDSARELTAGRPRRP